MCVCVCVYSWHTLLSLAAVSLAKCQPLLAFLFKKLSYIPSLFQFFWQFFNYVSLGVPLVVQGERHARHLSLPWVILDANVVFSPRNSSMVFSIFGVVQLSPRSILETFHHPEKKLHTHWQSLHVSPQFFVSGNHSSTLYLWICLFWTCSLEVNSFLWPNSISSDEDTTFCSSIGWWAFGLLPPFGSCE